MVKLKDNNFKKKYIIKVPKDIHITYCRTKNIIVFSKEKIQKKILKLDIKLFLVFEKNLIVVTDIPVIVGAKNSKKLQGTTVSLIKHKLIEFSYVLFTKLVLVGVGYRVFSYSKLENQLYFKLGFSHLIYFNIPNNFKVFCKKSNRVFLYGNISYNLLSQTASRIRSCKMPEIYKGKGILYDQEKIILKKGKKI